MKNFFKYKNKLNWAISTLVRGDSDILEFFIFYYKDKCTLLNIGLHKPTKRIIDLIDSIINKYGLTNVKIYKFDDDVYSQKIWVNQIYMDTLNRNTEIDIYAHIDIDEFIYRFDLIENSYEPDLVLKLPKINVGMRKNSHELRWGNTHPRKKLNKSDLFSWDKCLYCIGNNFQNIEFTGGQHSISLKNSKKKINIKHLTFPIFYHLPYRNDFQAYSKFSNLLINFSLAKKPLNKTYGKHVFKRFLSDFSPNAIDFLTNGSSEKVDISLQIDRLSISQFSYKFINKDPNQNFKVDNYFYKCFLSYYDEKNSFLDFIEQDFEYKILIYANETKFK